MEVEAQAMREQIAQMQRVMVEHSRRCPILGRLHGAMGFERGSLGNQALPDEPEDVHLSPPIIDFKNYSPDHQPRVHVSHPLGRLSVSKSS